MLALDQRPLMPSTNCMSLQSTLKHHSEAQRIFNMRNVPRCLLSVVFLLNSGENILIFQSFEEEWFSLNSTRVYVTRWKRGNWPLFLKNSTIIYTAYYESEGTDENQGVIKSKHTFSVKHKTAIMIRIKSYDMTLTLSYMTFFPFILCSLDFLLYFH